MACSGANSPVVSHQRCARSPNLRSSSASALTLSGEGGVTTALSFMGRRSRKTTTLARVRSARGRRDALSSAGRSASAPQMFRDSRDGLRQRVEESRRADGAADDARRAPAQEVPVDSGEKARPLRRGSTTSGNRGRLAEEKRHAGHCVPCSGRPVSGRSQRAYGFLMRATTFPCRRIGTMPADVTIVGASSSARYSRGGRTSANRMSPSKSARRSARRRPHCSLRPVSQRTSRGSGPNAIRFKNSDRQTTCGRSEIRHRGNRFERW